MKTEVTHFNNALQYRMLNKRISVVRHDNKDNFYTVETKILVVAKNDEEKNEYLERDSPDSIFKHRSYSKYCVWCNRICLSREAITCLAHSLKYLDNLKKQ